MRKLAMIFLGVTLLAAPACDDDETTEEPILPDAAVVDAGPTVDGAAEVVVVRVRDNRFDPATVTIRAGTTVRWENVGANDHTVTSGSGSGAANAGSAFDRPLGPGNSFEFTFTTRGSQPYFCRIHEAEGMNGTVNVE
ncbi:MAG: cupredoxin domain-containing protein [Deltaproteobacteria bacterium]|nr:cupredoxin domain-containing protein [Deltaproteobacteria bacterium]